MIPLEYITRWIIACNVLCWEDAVKHIVGSPKKTATIQGIQESLKYIFVPRKLHAFIQFTLVVSIHHSLPPTIMSPPTLLTLCPLYLIAIESILSPVSAAHWTRMWCYPLGHEQLTSHVPKGEGLLLWEPTTAKSSSYWDGLQEPLSCPCWTFEWLHFVRFFHR